MNISRNTHAKKQILSELNSVEDPYDLGILEHGKFWRKTRLILNLLSHIEIRYNVALFCSPPPPHHQIFFRKLVKI